MTISTSMDQLMFLDPWHLHSVAIRQEVRKERPGEAAKWVTEAFSFAALMGLVGTVILATWRFFEFLFFRQTYGYHGGV